MTPFQEQSLVRQLRALRATPLPAGFEERLLERLEEEVRGPQQVVRSGVKRARGKLILLAAIFVPFAAAASELAWRTVQVSRAYAEFAKDAPTVVVNNAYTPRTSSMLNSAVIRALASRVEPAPVTESVHRANNIRRLAVPHAPELNARATSADHVAREDRRNSRASGSTRAERGSKIERLTPNWERLGNTETTSRVEHPSNHIPMGATGLGHSDTAANHRFVERNAESRAAERHGSGNGEGREQQRERLRLGQ